jgi:hypothetical protein
LANSDTCRAGRFIAVVQTINGEAVVTRAYARESEAAIRRGTSYARFGAKRVGTGRRR